jgi:hypothetical protein
MKRRTFTKLTGAGILLPPFEIKRELVLDQSEAKTLLSNLIKQNDSRIPDMLTSQERDYNSKWYGGVRTDTEVFYAGHAAGFIKNLSSCYVSEESEYYHSSEVLSAMVLASKYLLNAQYEDGNIDLPSTNFHSPPDTAFVVEPLCIAYSLLSDLKIEETNELLGNLKRFLIQSGKALTVGGIHTANHRWVVCMALARLNQLYPNPFYLERIDQWLAEKIDIDPDGQYAEKSTLIYTPLVNLDMTMYYIHPNGEIATESSGRQDRYQQGTMQNYLYAYRYMSILDKNG